MVLTQKIFSRLARPSGHGARKICSRIDGIAQDVDGTVAVNYRTMTSAAGCTTTTGATGTMTASRPCRPSATIHPLVARRVAMQVKNRIVFMLGLFACGRVCASWWSVCDVLAGHTICDEGLA